MLVGFWLGSPFADVAGEVDLHPLAEEAGAGEVFGEKGPLFSAVASLFDHFALGGGEGGFAGFYAAGGEFEEELAGGVAILALEDDFGVGGIFGLVNGEDDDGTVVADDVAGIDTAAGFFYGIGEDGEDFAFIVEFRRDKTGFLCAGGEGFC